MGKDVIREDEIDKRINERNIAVQVTFKGHKTGMIKKELTRRLQKFSTPISVAKRSPKKMSVIRHNNSVQIQMQRVYGDTSP